MKHNSTLVTLQPGTTMPYGCTSSLHAPVGRRLSPLDSARHCASRDPRLLRFHCEGHRGDDLSSPKRHASDAERTAGTRHEVTIDGPWPTGTMVERCRAILDQPSAGFMNSNPNWTCGTQIGTNINNNISHEENEKKCHKSHVCALLT